MKKLTFKQFNKHYKNAYKNAKVEKVLFYSNYLDNTITHKIVKLSNDIIIDKTYYSNRLQWVSIDKLSANDLNNYAINTYGVIKY